MLFIVLGVLGLALLGLGLWEWRLQSRKQQRSTHILSTVVRILTVLEIAIFAFGFFYVGIIPGPLEGGQTPQLLIESGSGTNGVPNLAVIFRTPTLHQQYFRSGVRILPLLPLMKPNPAGTHLFTDGFAA